MSGNHVFFYETFEEEAAALRAYLPPGVVADFTANTIQEQGDRTPPAPIISIRTQSKIPAEWASQMDGILSRSTGFDHLNAYRCETKAELAYGYLPLYCNRAVAEQAMLLWMSLLRKLPRQMAQFHNFHRDGISGRECAKKNLLVIGVGNIGYEVTRIGAGLDMNVGGVDLVRKWDDVTYVRAEDALPEADIVVCAMNLTSENHNYFNYDRLKRAKPGTVFINVARGELSNAVDLLRLLDEGVLGGVGLDVYNEEPEFAVALREDRCSSDPEVLAMLELGTRPNVICTPHNAFNTLESVDRKASQSLQQVQHLRGHGRFLWEVPQG